jgi:hypothetical protein
MAETAPDRSAQVVPDASRKIQWAQVTPLDQKVDALAARNWISEELIQFSSKHWHCTREEAIVRLTADAGQGV